MNSVEGPQIITISFLKPSRSDYFSKSFIDTVSKNIRSECLSSTLILPEYKRNRITPTITALAIANIPVIPSNA